MFLKQIIFIIKNYNYLIEEMNQAKRRGIDSASGDPNTSHYQLGRYDGLRLALGLDSKKDVNWKNGQTQ